MRLLKIDAHGRLSLIQCHREIPPYAILSHTWQTDEDEEVGYFDFEHGTAAAKPGYQKILFCTKQARKDGLNHCWIDTCCINRLSEVELSESIRSMFRWYRDADRCYVYLSDVDCPLPTSSAMVERQMIRSRWFDRGWTVPELLAPESLVFFDYSGRLLGCRTIFGQIISQRTGIPQSALRGTCRKSMQSFSVDERLSWFEKRTTKRKEDIIYASLGLFDLHMPILYGEGPDNARDRLLQHLDAKAQGTYYMLLPVNMRGVLTIGKFRLPSQSTNNASLLDNSRGVLVLLAAAQSEHRSITSLVYPHRDGKALKLRRKTMETLLTSLPRPCSTSACQRTWAQSQRT